MRLNYHLLHIINFIFAKLALTSVHYIVNCMDAPNNLQNILGLVKGFQTNRTAALKRKSNWNKK